jgi:hypothetical protein
MSFPTKFQTIAFGIANLHIGNHYTSYSNNKYLGKLISEQDKGYYTNPLEYSSYGSRLVLTFQKEDGTQYNIDHTNGWDYNLVEPISI